MPSNLLMAIGLVGLVLLFTRFRRLASWLIVTSLVGHRVGRLFAAWTHVVVGKILEHDTYGYGFDAQTGEFGNLVSKRIIDPTKVVRIALQDGASIAGLLITTEAMVAEKPKKETPMPAMPPGGGMDY